MREPASGGQGRDAGISELEETACSFAAAAVLHTVTGYIDEEGLYFYR